MSKNRTLEVGDRVRIENWMHTIVVTITRVTKTKAVAKVVRKDGTSYEYVFKREMWDDTHVKPWGDIPFDSTSRTLVESVK